MQRFETVKGDTGKSIEAVLSDAKGPVSLLGAVVNFLMRPTPESGLTAPVVNAVATVVNANAAVGDPDRGRVRYKPVDADVAVVGLFRGQFRAQWSDGAKTFPSPDATDGGEQRYIEIIIGRSLV